MEESFSHWNIRQEMGVPLLFINLDIAKLLEICFL